MIISLMSLLVYVFIPKIGSTHPSLRSLLFLGSLRFTVYLYDNPLKETLAKSAALLGVELFSPRKI